MGKGVSAIKNGIRSPCVCVYVCVYSARSRAWANDYMNNSSYRTDLYSYYITRVLLLLNTNGKTPEKIFRQFRLLSWERAASLCTLCTIYVQNNDVTALASVVEHAAAMTSAHARKTTKKHGENVSPARYGDITLVLRRCAILCCDL